MKRKIITAILTALVLSTSCTAVKKERKQENATSLEVSFNYQRQNDHGSNQYAVWIENESGDVVKTLFVTSFTAKGRARGDEKPVRGYIKRPYCVPNWVKAAKADNLSDQQIDAVSGATPQVSGLQTFTWDFTDQDGKKVEYGTYKVFVEATLFDPSSITHSGTFTIPGKPGERVTFSSRITVPNEKHQDMVTGVQAVLR